MYNSAVSLAGTISKSGNLSLTGQIGQIVHNFTEEG